MDKDIRGTEKYYSFQQKEWVAFRIFWIFLSLILLAATFGLFGKGLLSDRTYTSKGVRVEYNKFMRVEKGAELVIHLTDSGENGQISINNDYLHKVRIEQVIPEPVSVKIKNNNLIYTFNPVQNGFIIFYLVPTKMGSHGLTLSIAGEQMCFNQFIYF